ncbi:MAG TPA: superinfection immunity protein [Candidatus Saccharimonadales bacterium]|nr:superinfection immunity protein [Candidatus Saccharimonadales bacterium]
MFALAFSVLLYFLPAIIGRHKRDAAGIFLVNLLLGWTLIGWIIALIWACTSEDYAQVRYVHVHPAGLHYCCQCGCGIAYPGAHFCTACGRAV